MLKNKAERIEYVNNDDNWVLVGKIEKTPLRVLKLKGTTIINIEMRYADQWLGERWVSLGHYELTDDGILANVYDLTTNAIVDYLTKH